MTVTSTPTQTRSPAVLAIVTLVLTWFAGAIFPPLGLVVAIIGAVAGYRSGVRGPWLAVLGFAVVVGVLMITGMLESAPSTSPEAVIPSPPPS